MVKSSLFKRMKMPILASVVISCLVAMPMQVKASAACTGGGSVDTALPALINQYRAQNGLSQLAIDPGLSRAGASFASEMAASGIFGHNDASTVQQRFVNCGAANPNGAIGEIIAAASGGTPQSFLAQYLASSEHAAIITGTGWKSMGGGTAVGIYHDPNGQTFQNMTYSVVEFSGAGTSSGVMMPPPPPSSPPPSGGSASSGGSGTSTSSGTGSFQGVSTSGGAAASTPGFFSGSSGSASTTPGVSTSGGCVPPTCASTIPVGVSSGGVASTGSSLSTSGGAPASTPGFFGSSGSSGSFGTGSNGTGGQSTSGGAAASTQPVSSSGGAAAGTSGTICLPPTCASTGR